MRTLNRGPWILLFSLFVLFAAGCGGGGGDTPPVTPGAYSISGAVTGPWNEGITVTLGGAGSATTTTTAAGAYSFTGLADGSYTVTPSLAGYSFTPAAPTVAVSGANKTQAFTGASTVPGYSISGTVSYAGAKTGLVYLQAFSSSCGNGCGAMAGTSIAAPGAYTIRGLRPGAYVVQARLDSVGKGAPNANDPTGPASAPVTIVAANATGANITLTDPAVPTPDVPTGLSLLPGSGGMLVFWDSVKDGTGLEKATSYNLCWAANTDATGCTTIPNLPANQDGTFLHTGLANGTPYAYKVRSNVGATTGAWSAVVTAAAGPATGGSTVSGTVAFTGTATGPLLVAVGDPNSGMQVASIPAPTASPAAFSVAGVPNGTWSVYAIIDQNNNGLIDEGDLKNVNGGSAPVVTVSGPTSGVAVTLSSAKGQAATTTQHNRSAGGSSDYYAQLSVNDGTQRVARAVIFSGKGLPLPLDVPKDREHYAWFNFGATAPVVGDAYAVRVTYADGSAAENLTGAVTAVLGTFATGLTETTTGGSNTVTTPTFSWAAPSPAPAGTWGYALSVNMSGGGSAWDYPRDNWMFPSTTTSLQYNSDGNAFQSSLTTGTYTWSVTVVDAQHNRARQEKSYTVP